MEDDWDKREDGGMAWTGGNATEVLRFFECDGVL